MVTRESIDPTRKYVVSVRVQCSRNLQGFRFSPACTRPQRREVERILVSALSSLQQRELAGNYYPLAHSTTYGPRPNGMTEEEANALEKCHFLFGEPRSRESLSSGVGRDWPEARGVFASRSRQFVAWVNEEDHLLVTWLQPG